MALPLAGQFAQKQAMNDDSSQDRSLRALWKWATTPPQVYVVYVLALILVWGISFLAGTLNPKRTANQPPPAASAPQR
jgi:hypothetical protein